MSEQEGTAGVTLDVERLSEALLAVFKLAEDPASPLGRMRTWSSMSFREQAAAIAAEYAALSPTPEAAPDGLREAVEHFLTDHDEGFGSGIQPWCDGRCVGIRNLRAVLAAADRSLDAAWAACEAALPKGWYLSLDDWASEPGNLPDTRFEAVAQQYTAHDGDNACVVRAADPTAALDALTAKLREPR